nr:hypothetical protein [Rhodospirillales bacterium]
MLERYDLRASSGDVGRCYDHAVVERFFGGLKHDWFFKVYQPIRKFIEQDVVNSIKYDNLD